MQPGIDYHHVMLLDVISLVNFRCGETLLTDVREIFTDFHAFFCPILTKFGTEDGHKHLMSICEFRENRRKRTAALVLPQSIKLRLSA